MDPLPLVVVDRPELERYEIVVGDQVSVLQYRRRDSQVILAHTEVPESLRNRGLASLLAKRAFDDARRSGTRIIITCPFVTAWLRRHPEYQDLVDARVR
jgi:predicted GNAT family acetyltransferase